MLIAKTSKFWAGSRPVKAPRREGARVMRVNHPRTSLAGILLVIAAITACGSAASSNTPANGDSAKPESAAAASSQPAGTPGIASPATSQSSGKSAAAQSPGIHPGHATPADAVDGFYQAALNGNWNLACSYVLEHEPCGGSGHATGNFTIVKAEISSSGALALVEVTGKICMPGAGCVSNASPSADMPAGSAGVQQAWADSVVTGNGFSPTRAEEGSDGGWYVDLTGNSD
jgi:hypothetical protein